MHVPYGVNGWRICEAYIDMVIPNIIYCVRLRTRTKHNGRDEVGNLCVNIVS